MDNVPLYKIKLQRADILNIPNISLDADEVILETTGGTYTGRIAIGTGLGAGTHVMLPSSSLYHDPVTIKVSSQSYLALLGQELELLVDNLPIPDMSGYALLTNVLTLDNITPFTPDADYEPATKKYVDDIMTTWGTGDMTKAVYDQNNNGIVDEAENAATVNNLTVLTAVPLNALFTDTTYDLVTNIADGLMSSADKIKLDGLSLHGTYLTSLFDSNYAQVIDTISIVNGHIDSITTRNLTPADIGALPDTYIPPAGYAGWDLYVDSSFKGTISENEDVHLKSGNGILLTYLVNEFDNEIRIAHADTSGFSKTTLAGSNIITNIIVDNYGHVTDWVTRNLNAGDISAATDDHTHDVATQLIDGFMSAADKTYLDNLVATGGVQANFTETNPLSPSYIRNIPLTFTPSVHTHSVSDIIDFPTLSTDFLSLTDVTPTTYLDQAGKFVKVNSGETGLEFGTVDLSSIHTHSNKLTLDAIEEALTTALKSNYDTAYSHSQTAHAPSNAEQNVNADWNASSGDAQILNKPTSFTPESHTHSYIDLNDTTDTSYAGKNTYVPMVNSGATGLELTQTELATFLILSDTPSSYSGAGSKLVAVNAGGTALEFIASSGISDGHTHSNKATLDGIQEALTTALKSNYDTAYSHSQAAHAPTNADNTAANETSHADVLVDGDIGVNVAAQSHTHSLADITDEGTIASKNFWEGTQAAYDAISPKDSNTLYFITQ